MFKHRLTCAFGSKSTKSMCGLKKIDQVSGRSAHLIVLIGVDRLSGRRTGYTHEHSKQPPERWAQLQPKNWRHPHKKIRTQDAAFFRSCPDQAHRGTAGHLRLRLSLSSKHWSHPHLKPAKMWCLKICEKKWLNLYNLMLKISFCCWAHFTQP